MSTAGAVNPVNVIQNVAPVARQSDNAAADVPFNQVLSREIADRRGAGNESAAGQAQPNTPQRQAPAPGAVKTSDTEDAKAAAPKQDDDARAADAASAEMLAFVSNLVQAAGLMADPSVQAAATDTGARGVDASRAGAALLAVEPAVLGRVMPRTSQAQAKIPVDAPMPSDPSALPADAADALATSALPEPAVLKPANDAAQAVSLPDKTQPALIADLPRQAPAPASAESKAPPQQPDKAAVKGETGVNFAAQNAAVEQTAANATAAAAAEPKLRAAAVDAKKADSKPIEAGTDASAQPAASAANAVKPSDAAKAAPAAPAVDFSAVKAHEAAPQANAANPAAMAGQIQQAAAFSAHAVNGNATEKLSPRVGTPAWDQALGQKVVWMVAGGVQSASLTLNPPDLGPLQVVLSVSNSQANASFTAAQPEVRQALEASMPRLREMLADSGIQLGQSTVSAGTQNQYNGPSDQPQPAARQFSHAAPAVEAAPLAAQPALPRSGANGLIDTFA